MKRASLLVPLLAIAVLVGACTDNAGGEGTADVEIDDVLIATADDVIVPSYEALVASLEDLSSALQTLCTNPSTEGLETAREAWREVTRAWRRSRPSGVGPAMDRRLATAIAFPARADDVTARLDGTEPVDQAAIDAAGASVKGIVAIEIALFGEGADELASDDGARRCEYLMSATAVAGAAAAQVLADWTGGYRDAFVAGMDDDPQASLDALVNELIFRITEIDDQGLRDVTEASSSDDLKRNRSDGPAAFGLAELEATYEGIVAVLDDGQLQALVEATNADTGDRLAAAAADTGDALGELPDSVTASFADRGAVGTAEEAAKALKVLLSTEVASELGITIGFSDSDGDS